MTRAVVFVILVPDFVAMSEGFEAFGVTEHGTTWQLESQAGCEDYSGTSGAGGVGGVGPAGCDHCWVLIISLTVTELVSLTP